MSEREIRVGDIYKHFKGTYHKVIAIAKDATSLNEVVVYTHEDTGEVWVRDKAEFLSLVDKKKYPNVLQEYRFELVKE